MAAFNINSQEITDNVKSFISDPSSSLKAFAQGGKDVSRVSFKIWQLSPRTIYNFVLGFYRWIFDVISYHFFALPGKPLHNELALVLGSDSPLGQAFAQRVVKMSGSAICLDSDKDRGVQFVKSINDSIHETKAYFYECDVNNVESLRQVIDNVSREIGDISILINCSTTNLLSSYSNAYKMLLPIMKGNGKGKGRFVFLRTSDTETRETVESLFEIIQKDLKKLKNKELFASLANIYPTISDGPDENNYLGSATPDSVATYVLEGIAKSQRHVFMPGYMVLFAWWKLLLPQVLINLYESYFFGENI